VYRSADEPPQRTARPEARRAFSLSAERVSISDPTWCTTLDAWLDVIGPLKHAPVSPATKAKLEDSRRICSEFVRVLRGKEPGEGRGCERSLFAVRALGYTQALSSMFACPEGTFIELMATAPWNLLGKDDPPDPRTLHGAGSALVGEAVSWSRLRGCGGRVALQAENPRTLGFYQRIGFRRMAPGDKPLALVPRGESGWSPEILRVAEGCQGPEEERAPWLVLNPVEAVDCTRPTVWPASSAA